MALAEEEPCSSDLYASSADYDHGKPMTGFVRPHYDLALRRYRGGAMMAW
ncbi:MAG: hypothetical protein AAFP67_07900 [Pseudomonadota bacterium]